MTVAYVAHPIGAEPGRAENLARARRWLRWLLREYPDHAFVMPWLAYCEVMPESPENRDRGLRDDLFTLSRCDELFLVGGWLSPGMATERECAEVHGLTVVDLLALGMEPPP